MTIQKGGDVCAYSRMHETHFRASHLYVHHRSPLYFFLTRDQVALRLDKYQERSERLAAKEALATAASKKVFGCQVSNEHARAARALLIFKCLNYCSRYLANLSSRLNAVDVVFNPNFYMHI